MRNITLRLLSALVLGLMLIAFVLFPGVTSWALAETVYCVNQSGSGSAAVCAGGYYSTVQSAIDAASSGDSIRIADGTYFAPSGTVAAIAKQLNLFGGYGQSCSDSDFDPVLYHSVLDGQGSGSVISITNAISVELHFLTLTHGNGQGNCPLFGGGCGGGIFSTGGNLLVANSIITDNVAAKTGAGAGGGIGVLATGYTVEIQASSIISNTASVSATSATQYGYGGGVYINGGTVLLQNNAIQNNIGSVYYSGSGGIELQNITQAGIFTNTITGNHGNANKNWWSGGGGLTVEWSTSISVTGNHIENNWAGLDAGLGGGIYVQTSDVYLARNIIINNVSGPINGDGGGVYLQGQSPITISNNIIAHNIAPGFGGGVYVKNNRSSTTLANNTIADNGNTGIEASLYVTLTLINNLIINHTTGITTSPPATVTLNADHNLFWNIEDPLVGSNPILAAPQTSPDYHLYDSSPAVDAGLTVLWVTIDLDGVKRPVGGAYDIGAYEGSQPRKIFLPLILKN